MEIRKAEDEDWNGVWNIIQAVIATGDTYVFSPESPEDKMKSYWFSSSAITYVAVEENEIVGTFIIKENHPDLGSHVANASYMVSPNHRGKGIGRKMGIFSLHEAREHGFLAIQFNLVVKSNDPAVRLWQELGFDIIGEIPDAFRHAKSGFTNAYIMSRKL